MDNGRFAEGSPSWAELHTTDPRAATSFYGRLFGWTCKPGAPGLDAGVTFESGGRAIAAVVTAPDLRQSKWTMFVAVGDADKTAAAVAAAGGTVLDEPADRSTAGRTAVFADPAGVRLAIWQPGEHRGAATGEPGALSWTELITDDVEASGAFYRAVFGWELSEPGGPLRRREFRVGGASVAGLLPRPAGMPREIAPYWDVYLAVADAATLLDQAVALGASPLMPPTAIEHGTIAVLADPAGAVFTVIAPHGDN